MSRLMEALDRRSSPVQPRKRARRMTEQLPLPREFSSWCLPVVVRPVLDSGPIEPGGKGSSDDGFVFVSRSNITGRGPLWLLGVLLEFYGRDRPLSIVSLDRDSHAVKFVQPNIRNCPGFSIGENDSFPDKFRLHLPERGEDHRRAELHSRHGVPEVSQASESAGSCCL